MKDVRLYIYLDKIFMQDLLTEIIEGVKDVVVTTPTFDLRDELIELVAVSLKISAKYAKVELSDPGTHAADFYDRCADERLMNMIREYECLLK